MKKFGFYFLAICFSTVLLSCGTEDEDESLQAAEEGFIKKYEEMVFENCEEFMEFGYDYFDLVSLYFDPEMIKSEEAMTALKEVIDFMSGFEEVAHELIEECPELFEELVLFSEKLTEDIVVLNERVNQALAESLFKKVLTDYLKAIEEQKRREAAAINRGSFTDERDRQTYTWIRIGNQVWMSRNLNYSLSGASWCYANDPANCNKYGRLYDYETALDVCPRGWRLPQKSDYEILMKNYGENAELAYRSLVQGGNSGFSAQFGGWRGIDGIFYGMENAANFWTATGQGNRRAFCFGFDKDIGNADFGTYVRRVGLSVRCIRN